MSTERVEETCACGARFVWSGDSMYARDRQKAWRADHRHAESVGICADLSAPLLLRDGGTDQACCELLAGHLGAHSDGGGRWWIKPDPLEAMQARVNRMVGDQEFIAENGTFPPRYPTAGHGETPETPTARRSKPEARGGGSGGDDA